ncbi:MAG: hypothetical protein V3S29_13650 [bacterium]
MSEISGEQGQKTATIRPLAFRVMRVESDFRRDTRGLDRWERDEYSSTIWNLLRMERKPKVAILDLVGPTRDNPIEFHHEEPLTASVAHYHRKNDRTELRRVLKFYCAYLMQQARKEPDQTKQLFCVFKVVDCARMMVQSSPYAVNAEAEALVFGIFHDLGTQLPGRFKRYLETEQRVFNTMKRLQVSPTNDMLRLELADAFQSQTSHADALAQYHQLLDRFPRMPREGDTRRGRIFIKIGEVFQTLADQAQHGSEALGDARKLKNFVERYNRDFAERGRKIPALQGPAASQIAKVARAMREISSRWYLRALAVRTLNPRTVTRQVVRLAENYSEERRPKEALKLLLDAYPYWRRVDETVESIPERINYLTMIANTAMVCRARKRVDWANQELREHQNRLNDMLARDKEREARREALLAGEEMPA